MEILYIPILQSRDTVQKYLNHPFTISVVEAFEKLYPEKGFIEPWIGYFALMNDRVIGVGGYKGPPVDGKIEIAYGTMPGEEGKGISTHTCNWLCTTALSYNPKIRVTARTLIEENASTSILKKNGFKFIGIVNDPEDGKVWEWEFFQL